jgi:hypothetical protein
VFSTRAFYAYQPLIRGLVFDIDKALYDNDSGIDVDNFERVFPSHLAVKRGLLLL